MGSHNHETTPSEFLWLPADRQTARLRRRIRAEQIVLQGVHLPYLKFPSNPMNRLIRAG